MTTRPGRLGRRLRRILLLLPYAIKHPGVSVEELAARFGVAQSELIDDLNLVFLCGLPGYGPGDLIDVFMDDDRVYVSMADYFAAPLRLTPTEALTLLAGGAAITGLPGMEGADALARALGKLGAALGLDGAAAGESGVEVGAGSGPARHLTVLQTALSERRRVRLEYLSAGRGELTEREVDPWALVAALGRWYLVAFDHLSGEERMFRTDRMKSVEMRDAGAEPPADLDLTRYRRAWVGRGGGIPLSFEISPAATRWFEEYYPLEGAEDLPDGWRRVTLEAGGERWAATLVLRLGRDVRAVQPAGVREEAGRIATRLSRRHQALA